MKLRSSLLILFATTACSGDAGSDAAPGTDAAPEPLSPDQVDFAEALAVDLSGMDQTESGLYVERMQEGEGAAAAVGDSLYVDYTVWLPDGSKLDSSFDHDPPAPLGMKLGETALIAGWVEGVTGMRLGEKRRLVVPWDLAYGAAGRPGAIPPYSTLVFEVELAGFTPGTG